MKKLISFILTTLFLIACEGDPNEQIDEGNVKDNFYYSQEIGWKIQIPDGWDVISRSENEARNEKGRELIKESTNIDIEATGLKQLICFQKGKFHMFQSTSELFNLEYEGEYEESKQAVKDILHSTFTNNGIKVDTSSSTMLVGNLLFDRFHITLYGPNGDILLHQDLYSRLINGFDFGVNINYIDDEEKAELTNVWQNSTFEKR